ncbi:hypothetical protein GJAV_G00018230 [Gymnothorax javanicus]|nr:hypothetical protein GJAV_G00018230 [Gymnothorax javanicus]
MAVWFHLFVGLGLLLSMTSSGSETHTLSFTPDEGMRATFTRQGAIHSSCSVCITVGSRQECFKEAATVTQKTAVKFTCSEPQKIFTVDLNWKIVCKGDSLGGKCSGDIVQRELLQFQDFNRTLTWHLEPEQPRSFQLSFSDVGMRQVLPEEVCPGLHPYVIQTFQSTGKVTIGTFCPNGVISSILAQSPSRLVLKVPGGQSLHPAIFKVSVGPAIKNLALVNVKLPPGSSAPEFFSPNYPHSFPDDDLMTWDFQIPTQHNFTMRILDFTEPRCIKKDVVVEYHTVDNPKIMKMFIGKSLRDPQPVNRPGNFSLSLRNCEMERKASLGLTVHFQVSAFMSSRQASCTVDLRKEKEKGVSFVIKNKEFKSNCEMKQDLLLREVIQMVSGNVYKLSFQNCSSEDLILTITKTIECQQWKECPVSSMALSVPTLRACLPMTVQSITWHLRAPEDGTVELLYPRSNLQQALPEKPCNASINFTVNEENGVTVGSFCPKGPIQKIQVHANVSLTAALTPSNDLSEALMSSLTVSFRKEISERYIFTVVPRKGVPVLLATPSWPEGMSDYSTVSWIVSVPPEHHADLRFLNVSQPKCKTRHTVMKVQTLGSREEMFSRREDEKAEDELSVPETFYLNMSNCLTELRAFRVLSQITLEEDSSSTVGIILGVIGGLLLLMLLILFISCVVLRKKKRQMDPPASIYNPNGASFASGRKMFPKSREDNASHIYEAIEDTMVYGHLLQNSDYPSPVTELQGNPEVETYRGYTGPTEAPPPPLPHSPKQDTSKQTEAPEVDVYRPFIDPSESTLPIQDKPLSQEEKMVENELYSPGSSGLGSPLDVTSSEQ